MTDGEIEEKRMREYNEKREAALEEFREFIKYLAKKGFTVQQLKVIEMNAPEIINNIIADIHKNLVLTPNLTDLLK